MKNYKNIFEETKCALNFHYKLHSGFIESQGAFCYVQIMKNELIINAIKRLVSCGMSPSEAFLICDDFIKRFGTRDLEACVRSIEVYHVA